MLLEFFERIGSLVPEYWSLKPNFKPEINSFLLSGRGYSINDFSTITAFIGEIPNEKRLHLFGSACLNGVFTGTLGTFVSKYASTAKVAFTPVIAPTDTKRI